MLTEKFVTCLLLFYLLKFKKKLELCIREISRKSVARRNKHFNFTLCNSKKNRKKKQVVCYIFLDKFNRFHKLKKKKMGKKAKKGKKGKKGKKRNPNDPISFGEIILKKILKFYDQYCNEINVKMSPDVVKSIKDCLEEEIEYKTVKICIV